MKSSLVSIIVPVFKKEDTLERCIQSILASDYKNIEVILIDDGSPDSCGSICNRYAAYDKRVSVLHKENGGVSVARNVGIEQAQGEFVTFVDADDVLDKQFVDSLLSYFSDDVDMVVGANRKKKEEFCRNIDKDEAIRLMFDDDDFGVNVWGKLYRRDVIGNIRFPAGVRMGEDLFFLFECLLRSDRIMYVTQSNYRQMQSEFNSSNMAAVEQYIEAFRIAVICLNKAVEIGLERCIHAIRKAVIIRALWTIDMMIVHAAVDGKISENVRKEIKNNRGVIKELSVKHRVMSVVLIMSVRLYVILFGNMLRRKYSIAQ